VSLGPLITWKVLSLLLEHTRRQSALDFRFWIHVDNVRIAGKDQATCDAATNLFLSMCRAAGLQIEEEDNSTYLGAEYNYRDDTVRPSALSVDKLLASKLCLTDPAATIAQLRELFSRCIYLSRIMRLPLAAYYNLFKFARRRFNRPEGDLAHVWPSLIPEWTGWIETLSSRTWTHHPSSAPSAQFILFTDASLTGMGAILCNQATGAIYEYAQRWSSPMLPSQINELEARAVAIAARQFASTLSEASSLLLVVDNSSTRYALSKGSAAAFLLNQAVRAALTVLPAAVDIRIAYIPSARNPADPLSRGEQGLSSTTLSACGLVAADWAAPTSLRLRTARRCSTTLRTSC
jgi:hypothetical protein